MLRSGRQRYMPAPIPYKKGRHLRQAIPTYPQKSHQYGRAMTDW